MASRLIDRCPTGEMGDQEVATWLSAWLGDQLGRRNGDLLGAYSEHLWAVREVLLPRFAARYLPKDLRTALCRDGWLERIEPLETDLPGSTSPYEGFRKVLAFNRTGRDERGAMIAARDLVLAYHSLKLMSRLRHLEHWRRVAWWNPAMHVPPLRNRALRLFRNARLIADGWREARLRTAHSDTDNRCLGIWLIPEGTVFYRAPGMHAPFSTLPTEYVQVEITAPSGERFPALLRARWKDVINTVSKTFEYHMDAAWKLPDLAGVAVLYRNETELRTGSSAFRMRFGSGSGEKCRLSPTDTPLNAFADPSFLVVTHHASAADLETRAGRVIEVQHTLANLDVDRQVSLSGVNTYLYHLRRHLGTEGIFRQMFPGVDWGNPDLRTRCETHVRASIAF